MSVRKRNEFLDGGESEEDFDNGYHSDDQAESRGAIVGRTSKRRKVERASDEDSASGEGDDRGDEYDETEPNELHRLGSENEDAQDEADRAEQDLEDSSSHPSALKAAIPKQVAAAQKAARRSGVVYISRVPPFMKPQTLKHFLTPYAPKGIGRLFLTPEDHAAHTRRVKSGGNKKKSFTDGWVEFVSKRDAKIAVETLNGNIIGGKKGNFYHDDLWSMKYLKGFKWSHLTEQIANENAERAARMREEVRRTKQENKTFIEDVERGKMLAGMESKRKAKDDGDGIVAPKKFEREFKQKLPHKAVANDKVSDQASRMRRLIF